MSIVKNIVFDLGVVIINLRTEKEWLEKYMLPLLAFESNDDLKAKYYHCFDQFEIGSLSITGFYKQLLYLSGNGLYLR